MKTQQPSQDLNLKKDSRRLYSAPVACPLGCKYCFAAFQGEPLFEFLPSSHDASLPCTVVYPSCDTELLLQPGYIEAISRYVGALPSSNQIVLTFSTKLAIPRNAVAALTRIDRELRNRNQGLLRVAVSFSTKARIEELEPFTASYSKRIETLAALVSNGILTSLTLKPVLPFVPSSEYLSILDDVDGLISQVTLGGLYVDPGSPFFRDYIASRFPTTPKQVPWLSTPTLWEFVERPDQLQTIEATAISKNIPTFRCDAEAAIALYLKTIGGL